MDLKELADSAVNMAPAIAGVLAATGVGAPVAGAVAALGALGRAFGLGSNAKPEDIQAAIAADPQATLKLRLAELDYQNQEQAREADEREKIRQGQLEELKTRLADVESAREREVGVVKATGRKDVNLYMLAWVIMGGFIGLIFGLIWLQATAKTVLQSDPLLTLLLGSLSTDAGLVVGYFFGSSKSSADKTQVMAGMGK